MIDWTSLSWDELDVMREAGAEVMTCTGVLAKTGDTVVSELFRGCGAPEPWRHYPQGDVYDPETRSQYYFHVHPEQPAESEEHGHFHTFVRRYDGTPADGAEPQGNTDNALAISHLVAIAVDGAGHPLRLFTTNRWVTGETWFPAGEVIASLGSFAIEHARPSWPVNRWISGMVRLFAPQIAALLRERDRAVAEQRAQRPGVDILEDEGLEVLSSLDIWVPEQVRQVDLAIRAARRIQPPVRTTDG